MNARLTLWSLSLVLVLGSAACNEDLLSFFPDQDTGDGAGDGGGDGTGSTDQGGGEDGGSGSTDQGGGGDGGSGSTDQGGGGDGGTGSTDQGGGGTADCATANLDDAIVHGQIYVDTNRSERSLWDGGSFEAGDATPGGIVVRLHGEDGVRETSTCADGTWAFNELDGDIYATQVVWPAGTLCRTRNCPYQFGEALERGRLKLVTFGDSVPVIGSTRRFPDRLAELLDPIVEVESVNVAVSGSTSEQWIPGTSHYDNKLAPHIASADIIIASIGGNDFMAYANSGLSNPSDAIAGFPGFVREVMGRVLAIKDAIRQVNPDADVVYLLYPNYSESQLWADRFGIAVGVIKGLVRDALEQLLNELDLEEDMVVVDFYGHVRELRLNLDELLYDELHFNDAGHQMYAERIFEALGGVRITGSGDPIGVNGRYALEP